MARLLVLGAGYIGAKVAELALADGHEVVLADNWFATERLQVEALGARVETVDRAVGIFPMTTREDKTSRRSEGPARCPVPL